jgi:hypothetical protein
MVSTVKVSNITTPDGTGNVTFDRPLSGSGASLTNLPAANLTGTLPALDGSALTGVSAGKVLQVVHTVYTTPSTGSTIFPLDNTVPQNTEGDEFYSVSITPTNALNILYIEIFVAAGRGSSITQSGVGLFQDSIAGALAVASHSSDTGNGAIPIALKHRMVAGTTSEITFKVRAGDSNSSNFTINRTNTQMYGGVWGSTITVTEVAV